MNALIAQTLSRMHLSEDAEGYLLGRGIREGRISDLGVVVWDPAYASEDPPDSKFKTDVGHRGVNATGMLAFPVRAPHGDIVGIEFRAWRGVKRIIQYIAPGAAYTPRFAGMSLGVMQRIWDGCDVWLTEGIFDAAAIDHIIPPKDVALATFRARVSQSHANFLSRCCIGTVHMVFDLDKTGRDMTFGYTDAATKKRVWGALDTLRRVGVSCRDVPYAGGKDPGEIWDRGGVYALRQAFNMKE